MNEEDTLLIDAPLIPDPDAEEEMGPTDIAAIANEDLKGSRFRLTRRVIEPIDLESIADEDLKGNRLLLVRRPIEPVDLKGTKGGIVQIVCTFQPAQGTRFTSAQFRLRLVIPEGIKIIDLAPRFIEDSRPVEFTFDSKGKLGFQIPPISGSIEDGISKKYAIYHCKVQGAGEGTNLARWDFTENPERRDGIGQEQVLSLTLPVTGQVSGSVIVSARLARSGLQGSLDAIRDMILGTSPKERFYPISFHIPAIPSPNGLTKFFRFL
jgi:hypothetical protein